MSSFSKVKGHVALKDNVVHVFLCSDVGYNSLLKAVQLLFLCVAQL